MEELESHQEMVRHCVISNDSNLPPPSAWRDEVRGCQSHQEEAEPQGAFPAGDLATGARSYW